MKSLTAIMLAAGLLAAAPVLAQTTTTAQKQHTQEGGSSLAPEPCAKPFNASPTSDPDCGYKQHTQTLTPSPAAGTFESGSSSK
jgi:hypothetical protein